MQTSTPECRALHGCASSPARAGMPTHASPAHHENIPATACSSTKRPDVQAQMHHMLGRVARHQQSCQPEPGLLPAAVHEGTGQAPAPRRAPPPQASRCRWHPCTAATRQRGSRASRPPTPRSPACCAACPWPWRIPHRPPRRLTPALHRLAPKRPHAVRPHAVRQRKHRPLQRPCRLLPRRHARRCRQVLTRGPPGSAGRPRCQASHAERTRPWCAAGASSAAPSACTTALPLDHRMPLNNNTLLRIQHLPQAHLL